jgi:hypothetical protein
MKVNSTYLSRTLRIVAVVGVLCLADSYTTIATAAQGCGQGFHRNVYGRCVYNHPGPNARPAPYHRGCWRNYWGQLRCYR